MIHDFSRPVDMTEFNEAEMLHGHVCIELKDERTGKRERIEHDNKFTNALKNLLKTRGFFSANPLSNSDITNTNKHIRLIGGVFLFDSIVPDDSTFKPDGVLMTANASYGTYNNSLVTELGSYNAAETVIKEASQMYVYDWTTSQGNGSIKSVCLTSQRGGLIGYGNSTSYRRYDAYDMRYMLGSRNWNFYDSNDTTINLNRLDIHKDRVCMLHNYSDNYERSTFKFTEWNLPIDYFSIFNQRETETIQLPNGKAKYYIWPMGNGKFGIRLDKNFAPGQPIEIYSFDCETRKIELMCSVSNSTGRTIAHQNFGGPRFFKFNDYQSGSYEYILDAQNKTISKLSRGSMTKWDYSVGVTEISDGLYLIGNSSSTSNSGAPGIYDSTRNIVYPINAFSTATTYEAQHMPSWTRYDGSDILLSRSSSTTTKAIQAFHNPLYLATVCNLDQPVTKNSSTTMKLIYTITPA